MIGLDVKVGMNHKRLKGNNWNWEAKLYVKVKNEWKENNEKEAVCTEKETWFLQLATKTTKLSI